MIVILIDETLEKEIAKAEPIVTADYKEWFYVAPFFYHTNKYGTTNCLDSKEFNLEYDRRNSNALTITTSAKR